MKLKIATTLLSLAMFANAWSFGRVGHDAVAYIAECNLTPTAKATVEKYLDGKSIVYYASWMDNIRLTPEYHHTDGWHSASVDANGKHKLWKERYYAYEGINTEMEKVENGKYKEMTDSAVAVAIKLLVHMVGDMHCPGHTFFEGTSQNIYFYLNDTEKYKFHKFWDTNIFDLSHKWYYTDYQYQLDRCTKEEKAAIVDGSLIDWIEGNALTLRPLYDILTPERHFDKAETFDLIRNMSEVAENQVLKGGYRVAHVLNSIFDPEYPAWKR